MKNIKQINGVPCVLGKVHLLPSGNRTKMYKGSKETNNPEEMDSMIVEKYFYITTDEEIKEGEWVYKHNVKNSIYKHVPTTNEWYNDERKIIATTDSKLDIKNGNVLMWKIFPKIPQQLIQDYCNNPVDEVWIEVEQFGYISGNNHIGMIGTDIDVEIPNTGKDKRTYATKLNSNNEILIHTIEEKMYSREEVVSFISQFDRVKNKPITNIKKWIEENL